MKRAERTILLRTNAVDRSDGVLCNAPTLTYRPRIFCDPLGVMQSSYIWSEALRLNHHRRAIPLITTNSAASVAPTTQSACAVDWSRLAVNEGSFAIISPAIQPNNAAPAQVIIGKRSVNAMMAAAPNIISGILTASPNMSNA